MQNDNTTDADALFSMDAETERWDQEWLHYFKKESMYPHLLSYTSMTVTDDISSYECRQVHYCNLVTDEAEDEPIPLHIWVQGDRIVESNVLEIGCGCGWLGKRLGLIAKSYLGIDASKFALTIARGTSPANCNYLHLSEREVILSHAGTMDTMVGRNFFIHQNLQNAIAVLKLGRHLLKPGGIIAADFFYPDPAKTPGRVYPADSPLDEKRPSSGFKYEDSDLKRLEEESSLTIEYAEVDLDRQRKFVHFGKPNTR